MACRRTRWVDMLYSCKVFASLIIRIQLESSVPSSCNENFSAGWWLVLWPQVLGRRGNGGRRDFCISKYLGSGCKIFSEHVQAAMRATGNQSLNETLDRRVRLAGTALVQTPARPCWNNPLRERVESVSICCTFSLDAAFAVSKSSTCLPVFCLWGTADLRKSGSWSLLHLDLSVTMGMGRRAIGVGLPSTLGMGWQSLQPALLPLYICALFLLSSFSNAGSRCFSLGMNASLKISCRVTLLSTSCLLKFWWWLHTSWD